MSERVELIIQDRIDILRDKALSLPPSFFSGSLIANSAGDIIIEFPPPATARVFHVEAGDVIEFRSLPIRSIISKSDKVNISLVAVPLSKVDIPYLNVRRAYSVSKLLDSVGNVVNPASEETVKAISDKVATEATLALIKAKTDNLDTQLSSRASEATLSNLLNSVKEKLSNVYATKSVTASANTAGLDCVLNNAHRSIVEVYVSLGGAGTIYVQRSLDGTTWRDIESVGLVEAGTWAKGYMTGWPWMRVYVPTTAIDITIEMSANP